MKPQTESPFFIILGVILFVGLTALIFHFIDARKFGIIEGYTSIDSLAVKDSDDCMDEYKIKVAHADNSKDTINLTPFLVKGIQPILIFERINPEAQWPCLVMRVEKVAHVLSCNVKSFEFVDRVPIFKKPTRLKNE